jgi:sarcosine oxidase gamma subunit
VRLWCGQCDDDSLTSDMSKKEVMLFKLGGAPECHAPELAQELRAAKAEVGACTRTLLTHAHVHLFPCA